METKTPMTPQGFERLKEKLQSLRTKELPRILKSLQEAKAHGDLSENAEYEAAKEAHLKLSRQIHDMESALKNTQVIDPGTIKQTKIAFGARVSLRPLDDTKEVYYQIVGRFEADVAQGKISFESPVAKALIGRQGGDVVEVRTPSGIKEYEVLSVLYR